MDLTSRLQNFYNNRKKDVQNFFAQGPAKIVQNALPPQVQQSVRNIQAVGQTRPVQNLLNAKPLPGQTRSINQVASHVRSDPTNFLLGSAAASGRLAAPKILQDNLYKPVGQAINNRINASSLGLVNLPTPEAQTSQEKFGKYLGIGSGLIDPYNLGAKVLSPVGKGVGSLVTKKLAVKTPEIVKKLAPAIVGEAAETATLGLAKSGLGQEFNPLEDLGTSLGLRGALKVPGAVLKKQNFKLDTNTFDELVKAEDMITNPLKYLDSFGMTQDANGAAAKQIQQQAAEIVDRIAGRYLPDSHLTLRTPHEKIKALVNLNSQNRLANVAVGLVDEQVPQNYRTDKITPNEFEQDQLNRSQFRIGREMRDVRSFEQMQKDAQELGLDPKALLKNVQSGRITDSEVVALKDALGTSSSRLEDLHRQLLAKPDDQNLKTAIAEEETFIDNMTRKLLKGGTEAGRGVVAFKILANKTLDPALWLLKAQRQLGDDRKLTSEHIQKINGFIAGQDRLGLANYISKLGESSFWEKATGLWKASLLTGLRAHEANIAGGGVMNVLETVKDVPATAFDMGRVGIGRMLGKEVERSKDFSLKGAVDQLQGTKVGLKRAKDVLKSGVDPIDLAKAEMHTPLRYGKTPLGRAAQGLTNAVFRSLGAQDKVFYETSYKRSLDEQMRLAKINGKPVDVPTEEMLKRADEDAKYATFTNDNPLSDGIRSFKKGTSPEVRAATDFIMPFTKTPTNVATATFVDYTPLGFTAAGTHVIRNLMQKKPIDTKELAEAFGRATTGTAILALGAELAKQNLVTGASPSSEAERAQWELEQRTPNSILVNGEWVNVSKISPLGNLLLLGAEYEKSGGDIGAAAGQGLKGFSENSFVKGLSSGLKVFTEPDRSLENFAVNAASGYVPTLLADVARGVDDVRRKPEGLQEKVMSRLPVLREEVPSRLNSLGEPVKEQGDFFSKMANPFNPSKPSEDSLVNEFKRVGYNLNYVGDSIAKQKLNRSQEREYQQLAGKYIRELVPVAMQDQEYQAGDIPTQNYMIERAVNEAKKQAREELKEKFGFQTEEESLFAAEASEGTKYKGADKNKDFSKNPTFPYKEGGKNKKIELDFKIKQPELTGDGKMDKELIARYKTKIKTEKNEAYKLYELGKITKAQLQDFLTRLDGEGTGGTGKGGGGGRGRKGKAFDFKQLVDTSKRAAIKTKAPKVAVNAVGFNAATVKPPEVKEYKVKDLKYKGKTMQLKKKQK